MAFIVLDNSPELGCIQWADLHISYKGTTYEVADGYTDNRYVWWDYSDPYHLQATNDLPALTDDDVLVFFNKNGTHLTVPNTTVVDGGLIVSESILADALAANCVTSVKILAGAISADKIAAGAVGAEKIAAGAVVSEKIAAGAVTASHISANGISANSITSGELLTALVKITGPAGYLRIDGDELVCYNQQGGAMGRFGYYEAFGAQLATFTRASTAYKQDGSSVASGVPRYEYTRQPAPVWQDLFDADDLDEYTSGGDATATWAVSGGVLTGTGGGQATLIKNDLLLQDCEIVVNCDQADNAGIIARYQDNNNYYLCRLSDDSGSTPTTNIMILKRVGGTFTTIVTADITWPRGTSKQVKFSCKGSLLEVYFDGVKVISVADTTFTGGGVGLRNSSSTAFRVLDFSVYYAQHGVMVEEGTTNLLTANQASVETDLTGLDAWSVSGLHTLSRDAATAWHGTASAKLVSNFAGSQALSINTQIVPTVITPGLKYAHSSRMRVQASGVRACSVNIRWYDASYAFINDSLGSSKSVGSAWVELDIIGTAPANAAYYTVYCYADAMLQNEAIWWDGIQSEQKAYTTSFQLPGSARAGEVLVVPTANVFTKSNWAVELVFTPTSSQVITGRYAWLWEIYIDANNFYRLIITPSGVAYLEVTSGGVAKSILGSVVLAVGQSYSFMVSGNGSVIRLCQDGVQVGTDLAYTEPVGTLPTNMHLGCASWGSNQANGIISDFRISSRARTLEEHQAYYASGLPLTVDDATTYLMSCDGTLQPTVRRFGLWVGAGEINGTVMKGNQIYASTFSTRLPGEIKAYAEWLTDGTIKIYDAGANLGMVIEGGGGQGEISWYLNGTKYVDSYVDAGTYKDLLFETQQSNCGIRLEAPRRAKVLIGKGGGNDVRLLGDSVSIDTVGESGGVTAIVWGNMHVIGRLSCSGDKPAIHQTESYGLRAMYARESPNLKFIEESVSQLKNGQCKVMLDAVFLETIEPDSPQTPWVIFCNPYTDIAGIYPVEIGVDYIIFQEKNGGTSNSRFAWSLSAYRKGFSHLRMEEYGIDSDGVLTSNWEDELSGIDEIETDNEVLTSGWEDDLL